jgi:hypothetical protein
VWEPVPGLSGTLDYWNIETKQVINGADAQLVVNNPARLPQRVVLRDPRPSCRRSQLRDAARRVHARS